MKPRALIIPATIRSHVLPSLYLADLLADEYEVHYAVTSQVLADIVEKNGYQAVMNSGFRVGYNMEASFLASKKQKLSYWRLLKAYRNDELYWERKSELDSIIDQLRPSVVIIDLFVCTDFWVLNPRRTEFKLLFFNPMPSTYRVRNYPTVSEGYWSPNTEPAKSLTEKKDNTMRRIGVFSWLRHPKAAFMCSASKSRNHLKLEGISYFSL